MKTKLTFLLVLVLLNFASFSQYIGVRARYTETRLVDDAPNPPKRENRLILSFYTVSFNGTENVFTPVVLSNYDIWAVSYTHLKFTGKLKSYLALNRS